MFENGFQKQAIDIEQNFKIADIATYIHRQLLRENCTQDEYYKILKMVEQRLFNKSVYAPLIFEEND